MPTQGDTTPSTEEMTRPSIPEMDALIGKKLPCLGQGWVMLVDYMGDDGAIVQAARTSYGKGTKKVSEDRGLIRYLMRHRHTTPFEMCELKLLVYVPMDAWRQWIRHRTASVNEYSTRYSIAIDEMAITDWKSWREQSQQNAQGSAENIPGDLPFPFDSNWEPPVLQAEIGAGMTAGEYLSEREKAFQRAARELYEERLMFGVAREQARKDLPLSTFTQAYWKIDLHNLLHFLGLRRNPHAQKEIREYAELIGDTIVAAWCPHTWEAFRDYREQALYLTRLEREIAHLIASQRISSALERAVEFGWLKRSSKTGKLLRNRERDECDAKLRSLGMVTPWQLE